jgi:hypothetical protein
MISLKDTLIPALDLMLILVVVFLLGIFAVRFVSEKGIGEESFFPIQSAVAIDDIDKVTQNLPFYAIILEKNLLKVKRIDGDKIEDIKNYNDISQFFKEIKEEEIYVIYENEKSELLGELIRRLSKKNTNVFLALGN